MKGKSRRSRRSPKPGKQSTPREMRPQAHATRRPVCVASGGPTRDTLGERLPPRERPTSPQSRALWKPAAGPGPGLSFHIC